MKKGTKKAGKKQTSKPKAPKEKKAAAKKEKAAAKKEKAAAKKEKAPAADLDTLRKPVEEAKAAFTAAEVEAQTLEGQAKEIRTKAKADFQEILAPYREACRRTGVTCEFGGTKAPPVAPRVRYLVERVKGGIKVAIQGRPETEETISDKTLQESVGAAAEAFIKKNLGDSVGNKAAGLGQRFRNLLAGK